MKGFCLLCFLLLSLIGYTQNSVKINEDALVYIEQYKYIAMLEMDRTGIPASITLAQGLLESGFGKSHLAQKSNNHFGIKCKSNWSGEKVYHDDDEQGECFRKYDDVLSSYKDHSDFLKNNTRYAVLFTYSTDDYKAWAHGLKKAGYATNPRYAHQLIEYIENYQLDKFTLAYWATVKNNVPDNIIANNTNKGNPTQSNNNSSSSLDTIMEVKQYTDVINQEKDTITLSKYSKNNKQDNISDVPTVVSREFDRFEVGKPITINNVPAICLPKGFSLLEIAKTYDIPLALLYKYNDMPFQQFQNDMLQRKMLIYLAPKKLKGREEKHVLRKGETIHDVSQLYGIKLKILLRLNRLQKGEEPLANQTIYLQRFNPSKPHINS